MRGATRTLLAVVAGFGVGLAVGPVSVFAINARDVLRSNEEWPAWRRGGVGRRTVTILPATLHAIVAVAALVREPQSLVGLQWYTLAFTAVIWSAGRIGQRIGRGFVETGGRAEPESLPAPRR